MTKLFKKYSIFLILLGFCNAAQAQLIINEVQSTNTSITLEGGTPDWVEIYNSGTSSVSISSYYLTDDPTNPTKWQFQSPSSDVPIAIVPGEYLVVLCNDGYGGATIYDDYYQTNFKLSSSGEEIHLYDASTNLISSLVFPALQQNESYGYNDATGELGMFSVSTIGTANGSGNFTSAGTTLPPPTISLPNQIFTSPQMVTLNSDSTGSIYYTLDGTNPTASSTLYTAPFTVNNTTVVKSIVIASATSESSIGLRTLLFNVTHPLPVISITSENYTEFGANFSQKPEFDGRIFIELLEPDGTVRINQYADYTASGATSNSVPQMNGKVRAKEKYGEDHFENEDGAIFPNKPEVNNVYGFLIRNSSQDWSQAHMKDAYASKLVSVDNLIDFGFQDFRSVVAYVNGEYQGILGITEDDDADFAKNNYPDESVTEYGHNDLFNMVRTTDMTDIVAREALLQTVNIRDYFFYMFHFNFLSGSEVSEVGYQVTGEKADWVIHDQDMILNNFSSPFIDLPYNSWVNNLTPYQPFKEDLIQSWCAYSSFLNDSSRVTNILDNFENEIASEIPATIQYYIDFKTARGLNGDSYFDHMADVTEWQNEVDVIRQIVTPRMDNMHTDFMAAYTLAAPEDFVIASNDINTGNVRVQGVKLRDQSMTGTFFKNMPIELIAEPKLGYQFSHWSGLSNSTNSQISVTLTTSAQITAFFEPIPITSVSLHINEVQSKNDSTYADEFGEYNDWIEIYNSGSTDVDLAGFYFSDNLNITNKYQILGGEPAKTTVPANGYLILWLDKDTVQGANHLDFKLNTMDQILMVNVDGVSIIDYLDFDLNAGESYGPNIDGGNDYVIFTTPTPNATNQICESIVIVENQIINSDTTIFASQQIVLENIIVNQPYNLILRAPNVILQNNIEVNQNAEMHIISEIGCVE